MKVVPVDRIDDVTLDEALEKAIQHVKTSKFDFFRADRRGSWAHKAGDLLADHGYVTRELYEFDEQSSELRYRPTAKLREAAKEVT